MTTSKLAGGLGFRDFRVFNLAMLGKQAWRLLTNKDSLLAQILQAKYYHGKTFQDTELGFNPSYTWRSILEARPLLMQGIRWQVGDGENINIWKDPWLPAHNGFKVLSPRGCAEAECVSSLIDADTKRWKVGEVRRMFMPSESAQILAIPLSFRAPPDRLIWHFSQNGEYTVKTAYALAKSRGSVGHAGPSVGFDSSSWRKLWALNIPQKIKHFIWRLLKDLLPTSEALCSRGLSIDPICGCCGQEVETVTHALFTCEQAVSAWFLCPLGVRVHEIDRPCFKDWAWGIIDSDATLAAEMMCMVAWSIWHSRNVHLHEKIVRPPEQVVRTALALLYDYKKENALTQQPNRRDIAEHWQPPPAGYVKINTDAAWSEERAGVGAVCRDERGLPLFLFARPIMGGGSVTVAELLAIREALCEASSLVLSQVCVESDCLLAVQAIQNRDVKWTSEGQLAEDIRTLATKFRSCSFAHIQRRFNGVAHSLAHVAVTRNHESLSTEFCLDYVNALLQEDVTRSLKK